MTFDACRSASRIGPRSEGRCASTLMSLPSTMAIRGQRASADRRAPTTTSGYANVATMASNGNVYGSPRRVVRTDRYTASALHSAATRVPPTWDMSQESFHGNRKLSGTGQLGAGVVSMQPPEADDSHRERLASARNVFKLNKPPVGSRTDGYRFVNTSTFIPQLPRDKADRSFGSSSPMRTSLVCARTRMRRQASHAAPDRERRRIAAASATGSAGGIRRLSSPSSINSANPPTFEATIGETVRHGFKHG